MEKFSYEGRKYWESFGKSIELLPRQYFDFISAEKYREFLEKYNLQNKKVIDLGAGYPSPFNESPEKELSPLASELQEILGKKGAKTIPVDVAIEPLKHQKEKNRTAILGSAFQLPFKDESIDGGAVILNLFNSSFKGEGGQEIFVSQEESEQILKEVYRVLKEKTFVIVNNYGYITAVVDGLMKIMGPEKNEIIAPEDIRKLAGEVGFKKIQEIPLDPERLNLGRKLISESFPEQLRERISVNLNGSGVLIFEK